MNAPNRSPSLVAVVVLLIMLSWGVPDLGRGNHGMSVPSSACRAGEQGREG